MNLHTGLSFAAVVLGLFLIPGPAVLLTLSRSVSGGRAVGLATGWGISTGDLCHAALTVLGLSAVLMTSAAAFQVVKFAGVVYLLYLGLKSLLERSDVLHLPRAAHPTVGQAFRQGVMTELLNPKTALFFLAFLPQFVRPAAGQVTLQLLTLGLIFVLMSAVYTALIALAGGAAARFLQRTPAVGRCSGKVMGTLYLLLSVRLAFERR